jgi:hypothetical protein
VKFIGQYIQSLISRFRNDVYLEDIDTGTIASGGNLGLDSNNKIVKATEATGDITGVDLTGTLPIIIESETNTTSGAYSATLNLRIADGLNIVGGDLVTNDSEIDHDSLDNYAADEHFTQANITTVGTIGTGEWRGTAINAAYLSGQSGTNTGDETLASINALDITEVGTIDSGVWNGTAIATDQQKHLASFDFKGYSTHDGTNYEIPQAMTDTNAPFEHNTSVGSAGTTAINVSLLLRAGGHVMPYAGTIKKWTGWAAGSGSGTINLALFRYRPDSSDANPQSLTLIDDQTLTAAGAQTVAAIEQTSFTDGDIAAGDIIMTGIKGVSGKTTYFTSTMEIEWD